MFRANLCFLFFMENNIFFKYEKTPTKRQNTPKISLITPIMQHTTPSYKLATPLLENSPMKL